MCAYLQATAKCGVDSMHCLQPFQSYWSVVCHEILKYLLELKSEPIDIQLALVVVRVHMGLPEMAATQIQNRYIVIIFCYYRLQETNL